MRKIFLFLIVLLFFNNTFAQYRIRVDSIKIDQKIRIKGIDRTSFFDNLNSSNQITNAIIADGAITKTKIADSNVNWGKLEATVYSDQIVSIDNDYVDIDISALGYNSPRVILVNMGGWPVYLESVTSNTVRVGLGVAGYGNQAKFDLMIINQ